MTLFDFSDYGALLSLVSNSLIAGALLGIVGGLVGFFVMARDLPFAVHGISELSFAGAAGALLVGADVVVGSVVGSVAAALLIGLLGARARERNSVIGVLMPFGLGLGILFLAIYPGRAANRFGLLTGQVVSVDGPQVLVLIAVSLVVLVGLLVMWRPLLFASVDEDVAVARGVPTRALSVAFMVLLALTVSVAVQTIGALLVLALLVTPAAAALRVASGPLAVSLLSMLFATVSVVGGILVALGSAIPISPFVTTISFAIYLVCRIAGGRRGARVRSAA
ncbi:metal ABC transporter permease [uncultured Amnibacterium sp.]|uniref:metal ABC transporter permease n=1 Tax=uncultured Amnibacterium sp. TaxID=1631851 RepID=UPI0035CB8B47